MRVRTFAGFVLGLLLGAGALGMLLLKTGQLRTDGTREVSAIPMAPLPTGEASRQYPGKAETPAYPPAQPPTPQPAPIPSTLKGEADRTVEEPDTAALVEKHLLFPVSGVSPGSISDTFSQLRGTKRHEALDIPAPRGTLVVAVDEGNVVKLFKSKQGGLTVYQFDNSGQWSYYYAHLDRYADGLKEGTLLRRGDPIGYVGSSGDASPDAPHLHFAIFKLGPEKHWWEGTPVNPYPLWRGK